jgi:hypothetical protein
VGGVSLTTSTVAPVVCQRGTFKPGANWVVDAREPCRCRAVAVGDVVTYRITVCNSFDQSPELETELRERQP